uniref:Ig-like domain-containing protein n=1 Tax=Cairina moschata TaxID=8855 RepID=A0A8C3GKK9_CAIMO
FMTPCYSLHAGHTQKDSVLQFAQETAIQVGHNTTLHCNFSTSSSLPNIFWYQQRLTQSPQFLLQVSKFKPHAKLQDSAVYLCALTRTPGACGEPGVSGSPCS